MWRKVVNTIYNFTPVSSTRGSALLTLDCGHKIRRILSRKPKKGYIKCNYCKNI